MNRPMTISCIHDCLEKQMVLLSLTLNRVRKAMLTLNRLVLVLPTVTNVGSIMAYKHPPIVELHNAKGF